MKTNLTALCIIIAFFLLSSCRKSDRSIIKAFVISDRLELNELQTTGKDSILVKSNIDLKINTLPKYLTAVILPNGTQQFKIIISYENNTDTGARKCNIVLAGKNDSIEPVSITFNQGGSAPFIFVNKSLLAENPAGQTDSIAIVSNIKWNLSIPNDINWIAADKLSGGINSGKIQFTIDSNILFEPRNGQVTIFNNEGLVSAIKITVSQLVNYNITDFFPFSGTPGTLVTMNGVFDINPVVRVNGISAEILSATNRQITFLVPANAGTGKITVSTANNLISSRQDFSYFNYFLTDFSPLAGPPGTLVTIKGSFGPDLKLQLNQEDVSIKSYTPSEVQFIIPPSGRTGRLSITSGKYTISSNLDLIVSGHNTWVKIADGYGGFYQNAVSFVKDDFIYTGLGYKNPNDHSTINNDFKIFNLKTHLWQQGQVIPSNMKPVAEASCFALGNKFYLGGGIDGDGTTHDDWWSYDPAIRDNSAWQKLTSTTTARGGGISFVIDNTAYVANANGGEGNLSVFNQADNSGSGSWIPVSTIPGAIESTTFVIGNYAYIAGSTGRFYRFNSANNKIAEFSQSPVLFNNETAFTLNGYGYVIYNKTNRHMYRYDPSADNWMEVVNQSPDISGVYNAKVVNGVAYAWMADGTMYEFVS